MKLDIACIRAILFTVEEYETIYEDRRCGKGKEKQGELTENHSV